MVTDNGFLSGIRILEFADERGEYAGKVLAGLGAEVIKIECPGGEVTRGYGPFLDDERHHDRSLHFWHYNLGKQSVVLDLENPRNLASAHALVEDCDAIISTRPKGYMEALGLDAASVAKLNPRAVYLRISPFGYDGPWSDYEASDLVHLALGGVVMNCGYDPAYDGTYDTAPVAPQMWQAYHLTGELGVLGVLGALFNAHNTNRGQLVDVSVHQAVSQATETDLPNWIYNKQTHFRATCRHSLPQIQPVSIAMTKDGRWLLPYRTYLTSVGASEIGRRDDEFFRIVDVLKRYGLQEDLDDPRFESDELRETKEARLHYNEVLDRFVRRFQASDNIWKDFQDAGMTWAPLRRPEENVTDRHWLARNTFVQVDHPELDKSFMEVGAKWYCAEVPWTIGSRAPLLGEHTGKIIPRKPKPMCPAIAAPAKINSAGAAVKRAAALDGIRFLDLGWVLASAGAGRTLTGLGAEVIKVEYIKRVDRMRWWGAGRAPLGGRAEREAATEPLTPPPASLNRSGFFMEINSGKRAISLNLKKPRGRELLLDLVSISNVIGEGFSPGTMDALGLGYEALKQRNSSIVYVQQSGFGQFGEYGRLRSYGQVAQAFSGLSEMSGMPEPWPPAGIGFSYLDWFGAYNMAMAILAGVYRQKATGKGCWIDSSQVESGIYLNGSAILDYTANGRRWHRIGNRSPFRPAAPHGIFRTTGNDRWIAIACFDDFQWAALTKVLEVGELASDDRFASLELRLKHQDKLEDVLAERIANYEGFALMHRLQAVGVPAGVCQTAEDRVESDAQLKHQKWMRDLPQNTIGTWPVREPPFSLSETPTLSGGALGRHGPDYAQDNEHVYGEILGLASKELKALEEEEVI